MSCLRGGKHVHAGGDKRSHVTFRYCWKWKVLLLACIKTSRTKGCWLTMNLTAMIESTRAQFPTK